MVGDVDGDDIPLLHQADVAAAGSLGGDMADGGAAGGAGEPAVGDEGHFLVQTHAGDGRGGVEHLPHARAALGAFVADDDHVAGHDLAGVDGGDGVLLAVKDPGGAFVDHHFCGHGGLLHHAAVGSQVALQHGDAAGLGVGVFHGADDLRVPVGHALQVFCHGLAGAGDEGGVQQVQLGQLLHDSVDAAGPVQILHVGVAGGGQVTQVGGLFRDLVGHVEGQLNAALMGDGRQMEHGVGGAAQGHVDGLGVVESGGGHDVPGPDVLFHQLHDLHASVLGQAETGGVNGGDGAVAGQGHADGLGKAVHGVCGVHAGAGAAGGAGVVLVFLHAFLVQLAGVIGAHGLEHVAQAGAAAVVQVAGQHGAAGDEDGGHVHPGCCHQQTGDVLVAVGDHHQAVKLVGQGHGLGGVGDQIPGHQGVLHSRVAHGDAVAHGDGGELHRGAPGSADACLHRLGDLVQVHVPGHDLVIGADHADEGALQLLLGVAQCVEQGAVGGGGNAFFHNIGTHESVLLEYLSLSCMTTLALSDYILYDRGTDVKRIPGGKAGF